MIHGGPRYLLNDVETTRHSCEDSGYIQRIVPHLLFRVPFLVPVPVDNPYGRLGVLLHDSYFDVYDRFSPLKNGIPTCAPHGRPNDGPGARPCEASFSVPSRSTNGASIRPACACSTPSTRKLWRGATIRTYTEVVGMLRDASNNMVGVRVREAGQATVSEIRAQVVVNCGGPWADALANLGSGGVRLRPGKGVHLIYEKRLTNFAIVTTAVDGREIFVMPYQNETWIGTTDDDYYGDLDDMWATQDEIRYLKEALERILPGMKNQRLIGTRVGVRNTLFGWGVAEDDLSRRYDIIDHTATGAPGLFSLTGGKLASFRIQSEEAANAVCERLGVAEMCHTHHHALPGGDAMPSETDLAREYGIDTLAARRLIFRHGSLAHRVLDVGRETSTGYNLVDQAEPTLECEIRYCLRNEHVKRLGDLMTRCRVAMGADMGLNAGLRTAQLFAEERGLDVTDERAALMDMLTRRWRSARPVLTGKQLSQAEALMTQYTGLWQLPSLVPYA